MNTKVRWVKSDNVVDVDASDAVPTLARSPMTWERASKVLTDGRVDADADDTNPVPALTRARARVDGTEEIEADDVLEVSASATSTAEIAVDDVLEEVAVNERERKTEPPASRSRKTDPPARMIPRGAPVPHWTDPSLQIPGPPSTPTWVTDARTSDPRREKTAFHTRPPQPASRGRGPYLALGAAAGAVVAAVIVMLILPASDGAAMAGASGDRATARVPTFHGSGVKHRVERSIGHGPVVPVFAVSALPR